jgi:hypothetical protein
VLVSSPSQVARAKLARRLVEVEAEISQLETALRALDGE